MAAGHSYRSVLFRRASNRMIGANQNLGDNERSPSSPLTIVIDNLHVVQAVAAASFPFPANSPPTMHWTADQSCPTVWSRRRDYRSIVTHLPPRRPNFITLISDQRPLQIRQRHRLAAIFVAEFNGLDLEKLCSKPISNLRRRQPTSIIFPICTGRKPISSSSSSVSSDRQHHLTSDLQIR
ncbi:hypothetical protein ACLOJK_013729 [Asimina triloba]